MQPLTAAAQVVYGLLLLQSRGWPKGSCCAMQERVCDGIACSVKQLRL
jgi:hypothetical protein